jgi:hypothetical protein
MIVTSEVADPRVDREWPTMPYPWERDWVKETVDHFPVSQRTEITWTVTWGFQVNDLIELLRRLDVSDTTKIQIEVGDREPGEVIAVTSVKAQYQYGRIDPTDVNGGWSEPVLHVGSVPRSQFDRMNYC